MFLQSKTDAASIRILRAPQELLNVHIHDLILTALENHFELSRDEFPSLYLAKLQSVSVERSGAKLSMRCDLHIKAEEAAKDAAIISLELSVKPKR